MRTLPYPYLYTLFLLLFAGLACESAPKQTPAAAPTSDSMEEAASKLRHMVIFKFKDEASPEDVERLNQAFNTLADSIPVVQDFEWGLNDSPEDLHQGFTHCYLLTFASEADRDSVYAPHPLHQAFVASLQPHLEKAFVVDYWTQMPR